MIIWSYFYISVWSFIRVALLDADTRRISKAKMEASAVLAVLGNVYKYIYIYYTYIIHLFYIYNIHILWILYCVYTNYILKGQLGIWMWHWVAVLWRLVLVGWTVCSMSFLGGWTRASWLHCARNFNAWQVFQNTTRDFLYICFLILSPQIFWKSFHQVSPTALQPLT